MTPPTTAIKGLYAVTPDCDDTASLLAMTGAAIAGGARLVQYRHKTAGPELRRAQAVALLELCRRHNVLFIVNDNVELAAEIGAPGVHIGRDDGLLEAARARLGPGVVIGVSCYREMARARAAAAGGANYIAFGGFYPSQVKPGAGGAAPALLTEVRSLGLPVVAIGGITPDNAAPLIHAGADAVAVITALYSAPDVTAAARQFSRLFDSIKP
jgi:thiamine-phosphate pyrophosphorylase